jgi:hypothetical protein
VNYAIADALICHTAPHRYIQNDHGRAGRLPNSLTHETAQITTVLRRTTILNKSFVCWHAEYVPKTHLRAPFDTRRRFLREKRPDNPTFLKSATPVPRRDIPSMQNISSRRTGGSGIVAPTIPFLGPRRTYCVTISVQLGPVARLFAN